MTLTFVDVLDILYIDKHECEVSVKSKHMKNAAVFKAFCDENRWRILEMLQSGEKCACRLLEDLKIGQSTLSHHMKILCDAGVVASRREGKWTHYSLDERRCEKVVVLLQTLLCVEADCECEWHG